MKVFDYLNMKFLLLFVLFSLYSHNYNYAQWLVQPSTTSNTLRSVYFVDTFTGWSVGYLGTILKTTNGGLNWFSQLTGINEYFFTVHFFDSSNGLSGGSGGVLYKTSDGGSSWGPINTGNTVNVTNFQFVNSSTGWYAGVQSTGDTAQIFKTTNSGSTWLKQFAQANLTLFGACFFYDAQTGWVAGDEIVKTTNGGTNWQIISTDPINVQSIFFTNGATGYLAAGSIFKTTNGGYNWTDVMYPNNYGLYTVYFVNNSTGWAIGSLGAIYNTTNAGLNWTIQPTGTGAELNSIFFPNTSTGWVVGDVGKIYKTTNGGLTGIEENQNGIPLSFALNQNYPNPFNPVTEITFDIPQFPLTSGTTIVSLGVFDVNGRVVIKLIEQNLHAGEYTVQFDGSNLSSGIFFYRLSASGYSQTKKMILIK